MTIQTTYSHASAKADCPKPMQRSTGLFPAIQQWRSQMDDDSALTAAELKTLRALALEREFSWDE